MANPFLRVIGSVVMPQPADIAELKPALKRELKKQADRLVSEMRSKTDDRTGNLDRSIRAEESETGAADDGIRRSGRVGVTSRGGGRSGGQRNPRKPGDVTVFVMAGGELTTNSAGYDYAMAKEFGTQRTPAEPFFWPTYRKNQENIRSALKDVVSKHLRKNMK